MAGVDERTLDAGVDEIQVVDFETPSEAESCALELGNEGKSSV